MHERNRHKPQWTKSALDDRDNSQLNDWSALSISHRDNAMMQPLRSDPSFTPCPVVHDDELFPNGIFVFNISRMLEYLENRPTDVELVEMAVCDLDQGFSVLNESHVDSVDLSRPVVLAEISPGQYNLIDGHHRVAKALRHGLTTLHAYRLTVRQHIGFLISKEAYLVYVEYWNGKVKQAIKVKKSARPPTI